MGTLTRPTRKMLTVAVQYPSLGPCHGPRLRAIVRAAPCESWRVVAMEMFREDSDYHWDPVQCEGAGWDRYTVMDCPSADGRGRGRELRQAVFRALEEIKPDVLVVNGWGHRESQLSFAWARSRGCPTVLLSDSVRENVRRHWWKELAKKWVIRGCKAAFVAGRPQARYVRYLGIPCENIFHPGSCVVDNDCWRAEAERARANAAHIRSKMALPERYFLCVSRFLDCKNLPFLVRAFGRYLAGVSRPWGLVICGRGPEEATIRSTVSRLGLDKHVVLIDWLGPFELAGLYALAGCSVLPSARFECWGLVVNEAMACGLPVLVSEMCGCAEDLVRNGRNGYVFAPSDEEALARLMSRVSTDEQLRQRMGSESGRIISAYSLEVGAENLWRAVAAARQAWT